MVVAVSDDEYVLGSLNPLSRCHQCIIVWPMSIGGEVQRLDDQLPLVVGKFRKNGLHIAPQPPKIKAEQRKEGKPVSSPFRLQG